MPTWVKATVALVVLGIIAYVVIRVIPPKSPDPDECALLASRVSASVDIDATVQDLNLLKTKIGVSAGAVQEVDTILKDYGFKYAAACRDNKRKAISDAEYNCKRDNMDRTLTAVRAISLTLNEVKNIAEPGAQKDVVIKNIETIQQLSKADYSAGCGSAMAVTPNVLTFKQDFPERTITIVNSGNRNLVYHVSDLPEAFTARLVSDELAVGKTAVVAIMRMPLPVDPNQKIVFNVKDNFEQKFPVRIEMDAANAALYEKLAAEVKAHAAARGARQATVEDALSIVKQRWPTLTSDSTGQLIAAGALMEAGSFEEANKSLKTLSSADPALFNTTTTQVLLGLSYYRTKQYDLAFKGFAAAGQAPGSEDERAQAMSKALQGAVLISQGKNEVADTYLKQPDVQSTVRSDPKLFHALGRKLGWSNDVALAERVMKSDKMLP